ncbi:MAG: hypothetical protein JNL08_18590 [Planctomycetes bacterium]|nr:hypothetical protein [Planctomycetota bacterium]
MTDAASDLDVHLAAIVAGDTAAFAAFVAGVEPLLRRALRAFAAAVDGESVVQETLLRAWQVAPRVVADGRPNGLLRWSLVCARNLAIDELRRARVAAAAEAELLARSERDVAAWVPPDPLLRERIGECRKKLPRQPARALAARLEDTDGVADRVLAERVGMAWNTFLQNITRARRLLAACLRRVGVVVGEEVV